MAKEDFCFTFYDGDATRDASHMNRLERGAYYDLIIAQRKFGRLSIDQIKKVLGKDFEAVWPALELSLVCADGFYTIEWIEKSLEQSRKHSRHQSENGKKGGRPPKNKPDGNPNETQSKANLNPTESQRKPLGDGDGNEDVLKDKNGEDENFEPIGIVPQMSKTFTVRNADYPIDQDVDFPAVRSIAQKVGKWQGLKGDISVPANSDSICRRWGELVDFIRSEPHFSGYSLTQINKYFQSIAQKFSSQNGTVKKPLTGSNRQQGANQLLDSLKNDLESSAGGTYNP